MYATLSALTRDELAAAVAMRRARPVGSCARAQAKAREELAKMQLKGWPEIAMANLRAIIRAGGTQIDTLSMATLMTCTEELVIALMAYGKISNEDFQILAEPLAHVALPWVAELRKDQASYERIKVELEEALTITPEPTSPALAARSVSTGAKAGRGERQSRDVKKPLKIGGVDVEKLRLKLEATEDEDMAAFMRQMREGSEPVTTTPTEIMAATALIEPMESVSASEGVTMAMRMDALGERIDAATDANDQDALTRLMAELDLLLIEQTLAAQSEQPSPAPETMPEVQPTSSPIEPVSIPLREDDLAVAGKPIIKFGFKL